MELHVEKFLESIAEVELDTAIRAIVAFAESGHILEAGGIAARFLGDMSREKQDELRIWQTEALVSIISRAVTEEGLEGGYVARVASVSVLFTAHQNELIETLFKAGCFTDIVRFAHHAKLSEEQRRLIGERFLDRHLEEGFDAAIQFMEQVGFPPETEERLREELDYHYKPQSGN